MAENEEMTPQEWITMFVSAPPSEQREIAQQVIDMARIVNACRAENHNGRLADWKELHQHTLGKVEQAKASLAALETTYTQLQGAYHDVWRWWEQGNVRADKVHDVLDVLPLALEHESLQQQVETLTKAIDRIRIVMRSMHTRLPMKPEDRLFIMMILNPDTDFEDPDDDGREEGDGNQQ